MSRNISVGSEHPVEGFAPYGAHAPDGSPQLEPVQMKLNGLPAAPTGDRGEGALGPYLRALRAHRVLVAVVTLAAIAASLGWLAVRAPEYRATAQLLVTPLPQDDRTFLGLQLIRDSGDPTRTVQTAAALVGSQQAALLTAQRLGPGWTARRVAEAVDVEPVGESNILAVSARWPQPAVAARLANEFAAASLRARRLGLQAQIDAMVGRLRDQLRATQRTGGTPADTDLGQLQQLQNLRNSPDPTLTLSQQAVAPASPSGAPGWLVLALAVLGGFTLAMGAALLTGHLNRRIRDSDEAVGLFETDVLARVPLVGARQRRTTRAPLFMPPEVQEAFRTLAVQLEQRTGGSGTLMITSASSGDGKTSSSIGLACALVASGRRVTLMDFDLRKPDIARLLGLGDRPGLTSLLRAQAALADLVVQAPQLPPLRVVTAGTSGDTLMLEPLTRRLPDIVAQARRSADYVIFDTPPLGEVSDALRMAVQADEILVVTRPGHTDRGRFELMRDLLERSGRRPTGMIVLGESDGPSAAYGYGPPRANGRGPRPAAAAPRA
jgi:Mrp family chromosome partitioning ATPase/capsular polysaccharide biosynthesis protein